MRRGLFAVILLFMAIADAARAADVPVAPIPVERADEDVQASAQRYLERRATLMLIRSVFDVMDQDAVQASLNADAEAIGPEGPSLTDQLALDRDLAAEGSYYIVSLRYLIEAGGAVWPEDRAENTYVRDALVLLRDLQDELFDAVEDRSDPLPVLQRAQRVWAWTEGLSDLPPDSDRFADRDLLVERALDNHGPWGRT